MTARASIDILHLKNYYDLLTSALDFPEREGERERKKRERERERKKDLIGKINPLLDRLIQFTFDT